MKTGKVAIIFVVLLILFFAGVFLKKHNMLILPFPHKTEEQKVWSTATFSDKKFSAKFPGKPTVTEQNISIGSNNLQNQWSEYKSTQGDTIYRVDYFIVPDTYIDQNDTQKTLIEDAKMMITLIAPNAAANPERPQYMTFQGVPTIQYEFKDDDTNYRYKMKTFNIGNSLYSVGVGTLNSVYQDYDTFVNSFILQK